MKQQLKIDVENRLQRDDIPFETMYIEAVDKLEQVLRTSHQLTHRFTDVDTPNDNKEYKIEIPQDMAILVEAYEVDPKTREYKNSLAGQYELQNDESLGLILYFRDGITDNTALGIKYYKKLGEDDIQAHYNIFLYTVLSSVYTWLGDNESSLVYEQKAKEAITSKNEKVEISSTFEIDYN